MNVAALSLDAKSHPLQRGSSAYDMPFTARRRGAAAGTVPWERSLVIVDHALCVRWLDFDADSLRDLGNGELFIAGGVFCARDQSWRAELVERVRAPARFACTRTSLLSPSGTLRIEIGQLHPLANSADSRVLRSLSLERVRPPCDLAALVRVYDLSQAEADILEGLCAGGSFAQLATKRGVRVDTIRKQTKSLYAKFGVHAKHEAVALAFCGGRRD